MWENVSGWLALAGAAPIPVTRAPPTTRRARAARRACRNTPRGARVTLRLSAERPGALTRLAGGEDFGACLRHGDGVLEVGCERAVRRPDRPCVGHDAGRVGAEGEHRLDRDDQPRLELGPAPRGAPVLDERVLVHRPADPVPAV